jgi:hypothetical protein
MQNHIDELQYSLTNIERPVHWAEVAADAAGVSPHDKGPVVEAPKRAMNTTLHPPKPRRQRYTPETTEVLKGWLSKNKKKPYPSKEEKLMLEKKTGLSSSQLDSWFSNARRRWLRK